MLYINMAFVVTLFMYSMLVLASSVINHFMNARTSLSKFVVTLFIYRLLPNPLIV